MKWGRNVFDFFGRVSLLVYFSFTNKIVYTGLDAFIVILIASILALWSLAPLKHALEDSIKYSKQLSKYNKVKTWK